MHPFRGKACSRERAALLGSRRDAAAPCRVSTRSRFQGPALSHLVHAALDGGAVAQRSRCVSQRRERVRLQPRGAPADEGMVIGVGLG